MLFKQGGQGGGEGSPPEESRGRGRDFVRAHPASLPSRRTVPVPWRKRRLAGSGGPAPQPPPGLPGALTNLQLTIVELSWDFGDVVPFDWRPNLASSDPTATFKFRWARCPCLSLPSSQMAFATPTSRSAIFQVRPLSNCASFSRTTPAPPWALLPARC